MWISRCYSNDYNKIVFKMNPDGCQYDPLYGYTQPQGRLTTAPDITTLTPFAPQPPPLGEYSTTHPLPTYDPYRCCINKN